MARPSTVRRQLRSGTGYAIKNRYYFKGKSLSNRWLSGVEAPIERKNIYINKRINTP